ncbi:MAG: type II toxin-antitoxin system VapC family toxin, partial [Terriglobales bacterium]
RLIGLTESGERITISTLVLFEWWRGPRLPIELELQERLFPANAALPFTAVDAELSAQIYKRLRRPRHREMDIAIAAHALVQKAALWTLNPKDFADIPGLQLL